MLREIVVTRQDEDKRNVTEINTILIEYNKKMIQSAKIKLHELKGNLMSNLSPALSRTKYRVSKTSKSSDTVDSTTADREIIRGWKADPFSDAKRLHKVYTALR
jgi:hypothetical protein